MKHLLTAILIIYTCAVFAQNSINGTVRDSLGNPISSVSVHLNGSEITTTTGPYGTFRLNSPQPSGTLTFSSLGYKTQQMAFTQQSQRILVVLQPEERVLDEVEVSTGYQTLPKERATGSFVQVDEKQLNMRLSANLLDRLEGIAPALQFDKRSGSVSLNIRGINTFRTGLMQPLIVVDNFPYEGDLNNINPDDVASVTILRDAAAASVWGARAGNGVIVINMKKPMASPQAKVSMTANTFIGEKPNLYYRQDMTSADFIEVETMLFENGFYDNTLNNVNAHKYVFSPVVDMLDRQRKGEISAEEVQSAIDGFKQLDYRDDLLRYFYRRSLTQQYNLSISGGNQLAPYRINVGYNRTDGNNRGSSSDRLSLRAANTVQLVPKLTLRTALTYTYSNSENNAGFSSYPITVGGGKGPLYPYARLVGTDGEALAIPYNYNLNYTDTAGGGRLLDWSYRPYAEMNSGSTNGSISNHISANATLQYSMGNGIELEVQYSHERQMGNGEQHDTQESYSMRNLINRFTVIDGDNTIYNLPLGGMLRRSDNQMVSNRLRGQLNYNRKFGSRHEVASFGGAELSDRKNGSASYGYYGYDDETLTFAKIDYLNPFPIYDGLAGQTYISSFDALSSETSRFVSFYANGSYTFNERYIASFSARRDASNLFGVKTNDRWKPLWSSGLAWLVSSEPFMENVRWVDRLRLRATYGHSGNAGSGANRDPIIKYLGTMMYTNLPYAQVLSPPNPQLKWEDTRMINYAVDFSLFNGRIRTEFEYFTKKSSDLIAPQVLDPTTGFINADRNVGEMRSRGFDAQLTGSNRFGNFYWNSSIALSYVKDVVTKYDGVIGATSNYVLDAGLSLQPLPDKGLYPVFSYRFAGLDPADGSPQGYLQDKISKDYTKLLADSLKYLHYHGSGLPPYHGFWSNTIGWKNLELFVNVAYKFGHYFRQQTINYSSLFNSWSGHTDINKRWRQPGDEAYTTVPSMVYPANSNRDLFYGRSDATIDRGDLIRLQDLRLSYAMTTPFLSNRHVNIQCYFNIGNIGLLWTANDQWRDSDYSTPPSKSYRFGLTATF